MLRDEPRQVLCTLVQTYGPSLCDDPRRCGGLLRDYCNSYRPEIAVLLAALEEGMAARLRATVPGTPAIPLVRALARHLQDQRLLSEEAARWAVESWALALGLPLDAAATPSGKVSAEPPAQPPPVPAPFVTAQKQNRLLLAVVGIGLLVVASSYLLLNHPSGERSAPATEAATKPPGVESGNAERRARLEAEQRARRAAEQEAELAAERAARLAAERAAQLAAERAAQLEAERAARLAAERAAQLEAERAAQLAAERAARLEANRTPVRNADAYNLVHTFLQHTGRRDVGNLLLLYDDYVDYYDRGLQSRDAIRKDKLYYFRHWLSIQWTLDGDIEVTQTNSGLDVVFYAYFRVYSPDRGEEISGRTWNKLGLVETTKGHLKIVRENSRVLERSKNGG